MNEWELTQKGYQHIFQQQTHECAIREAGTGLTFEADVKGGQGVVSVVTQTGSFPKPRCVC